MVRLKLKSLRQYFFKELKRIQESPSESAGTSVTRWEFFDYLNFLACTVSDEHYSSCPVSTPKCPVKRKHEEEIPADTRMKTHNSLSNTETHSSKQNYASSIGKSVECALQYYPMSVQFELGSKILELVHTFDKQHNKQ